MVSIAACTIHFLGFVGVWSEGRVELELMLTPELYRGVLELVGDRGLKLHWRVDQRGFVNSLNAGMRYDLAGNCGVLGYYGWFSASLYCGSRAAVSGDYECMNEVFLDLYDYGLSLGALVQSRVVVKQDGVSELWGRGFLWLPIMAVLVRLGIIRGAAGHSLDLWPLHLDDEGRLYHGGRATHGNSGVHFVKDGVFWGKDGDRLKDMSESLFRNVIEDVYWDISGFLRDFSR